ncbi:programmed cell death 1 ligand 1-like, partial [Clarias magur]
IMDNAASFLYICILITYVVREGDTAVLPCKLSNMLDVLYEMPHVKWNVDSKSVFERLGEGTSKGEGFEGRADVPLDELLNGNCSLVLKDVRKSDAGDYESKLKVKVKGSKTWHNINNIKLSVK